MCIYLPLKTACILYIYNQIQPKINTTLSNWAKVKVNHDWSLAYLIYIDNSFVFISNLAKQSTLWPLFFPTPVTHIRKSLPQINGAQMLILSKSWLNWLTQCEKVQTVTHTDTQTKRDCWLLLVVSYNRAVADDLCLPFTVHVCTWILFLASSRWWISLGQSCNTEVSCLSWQSRYFSPASVYSLHSWAWRLITPDLPLPRTRPAAPLSTAPERWLLRGSAEWTITKRRTVTRRRMLGENRNQVSLRLLSDDWWDGTQEAGHSCMYEEKSRRGESDFLPSMTSSNKLTCIPTFVI